MAKIQQYLDNIKNALFGREVRGSIHDGIDAINKEVERTTAKQEHLDGTFNQLIINSGTSNAEIVDARVEADGTQHSTLGERLDHMDSTKLDIFIGENLPDLTDRKSNIIYCKITDKVNNNFGFFAGENLPNLPDRDGNTIYCKITDKINTNINTTIRVSPNMGIKI